MLKPNVTLSELIENARKEMIRLNYHRRTISNAEFAWREFNLYTQQHDSAYFTHDLAIKFLREHYNYPDSTVNCHTIHVNGIANAIRKLGDLQLHGRFLGREIKKLASLTGEAQPFVDAFIEYSRKRNIVEASIHRNLRRLNGFFKYLQSIGVFNPCEITPLHISGYMASLIGYSKKTAVGEIYVLKTFFRAIYLGGLHFEDLSKAIPKFNFPQSDKIPTIWKAADVEKLLAAVDRGSPMGKRDYAILLLVVRLGLRDGDVRNIKFENFKWKSNRVELIQSKTSQFLSLPLLPEIGDAVIDYLQHGRPQSDLQYVFLKHAAPYDNFQKTGNVVKKYIKIAKIPIDKTKSHGVHALRHEPYGIE